MLVLTRRLSESIVVFLPNGDEIKIMITNIDGNKVRVGFELPDEVVVLREEILT